ncbi:MAG: cobalamin B12-binding domain-containing protein [Fusobacteriaceae bacterium]
MGERFLRKISDSIINMDEDNIEMILEEALDNGVPMEDIYEIGLNNGMLEVTKKFENNEYYVSEVIVCADTLNKGIKYLRAKGGERKIDGPKVLIAVVEGDFHEIGKNIVKIMFEAANFDVIDLGVNQTSEDIVKAAIENRVEIIALSTMMTTTMGKMKEIISIVEKSELKNKVKVIIGGGCISNKYAQEISADGYSKNAIEAVKLVKNLVQRG